jgi:hypothetical protein
MDLEGTQEAAEGDLLYKFVTTGIRLQAGWTEEGTPAYRIEVTPNTMMPSDYSTGGCDQQ